MKLFIKMIYSKRNSKSFRNLRNKIKVLKKKGLSSKSKEKKLSNKKKLNISKHFKKLKRILKGKNNNL